MSEDTKKSPRRGIALPHTPEGETSQKKEKQVILRNTGFDTDFNGDSPSARSRTDTLLRLKPSQ